MTPDLQCSHKVWLPVPPPLPRKCRNAPRCAFHPCAAGRKNNTLCQASQVPHPAELQKPDSCGSPPEMEIPQRGLPPAAFPPGGLHVPKSQNTGCPQAAPETGFQAAVLLRAYRLFALSYSGNPSLTPDD